MNIRISNGIVKAKQKVVIYGPEGIGKSTFASKFPRPLFIDTEGSTKKLDVERFEDKPTSWTMLKNYVEYVKSNPSVCETLVIDTIDWAERLCVDEVCARHGKDGIEGFGYGNGYTYIAEEVGRFLNLLQELIDKDICNVVLTAHAQLKKFEQPDEAGAYDRYELKLGKKTTSQTAPLVKEWADMILFANYETYAVASDDKGKKFKAQGGRRVMFTEHHPCWDAKNRDGLAPKLPFEFAQISHVIQGSAAPAAPVIKEEPPVIKPAETAPVSTSSAPLVVGEPMNLDEIALGIPPELPQALRDLMAANEVTEEDIRVAVAGKGYFPELMPVKDYPSDFINGVLIGAWEQVYAIIKENKKNPF